MRGRQIYAGQLTKNTNLIKIIEFIQDYKASGGWNNSSTPSRKLSTLLLSRKFPRPVKIFCPPSWSTPANFLFLQPRVLFLFFFNGDIPLGFSNLYHGRFDQGLRNGATSLEFFSPKPRRKCLSRHIIL